jgi:ribosome-associated protein
MEIFDKIKQQVFESELEFSATKSSGPCGLHVNKVNTKIIRRFNSTQSDLLSEVEKALLLKKLKSKLTLEETLIIEAKEKRSQHQNKIIAITKFYELLTKAFTKKKNSHQTFQSFG